MAKLDLKIVNGTIATAADVFRCDIGIRNGRIAMLGDELPDAEEISLRHAGSRPAAASDRRRLS
jgi:urease alpha subunit